MTATRPMARRAYICDWCGERIAAGTVYARDVSFEDGPQTVRDHVECADFLASDAADDARDALSVGDRWPYDYAIRGGMRDG